ALGHRGHGSTALPRPAVDGPRGAAQAAAEMFIGHFALGFAAKRAAPRVSLGLLIAAPILLDLVWPILVLAGIEHVEIAPGDTAFTPLRFTDYPISHSLLASIGWSIAFGLGVLWATRDRAAAALVGALVF